jgi:penicillin-binding protein-related factor A (putative recombinase)
MGGIKSQTFGSLFEGIFARRARSVRGLALTKFPQGARIVGKNKIVKIKTPCDWILTFNGVTALIDTKTTDATSFPFSKIKPHQVDEMLKHYIAGSVSGYVIWYRKTDDVIFVPSHILKSLIYIKGTIKIVKGSLKLDHKSVILLGKSGTFRPELIHSSKVENAIGGVNAIQTPG